MNLATLEPGYTLLSESITISPSDIDAYLAAVEDDADVYRAEGLAPPMAVGALVIAAAMKAVELPAGAVHTSQEFDFASPVAAGATVACTATVAQNSVRRGTRFLTLEITGDVDGVRAVTGRVSLAVAEPEPALELNA